MKLNETVGLLLLATATVAAGAAAAAVSTTSAPTTTAAAAPGGKRWHHGHGGMLVGMMLRATRQLNLTSDQQTAIEGILSAARASRELAAATGSIDMLALGNPGDPNYATALQSAKAAAAARLQHEADLQGQIYNVLTTEQKAKLPQALADMKAKAEQRRAAWQQEHGAAPSTAGSN